MPLTLVLRLGQEVGSMGNINCSEGTWGLVVFLQREAFEVRKRLKENKDRSKGYLKLLV